MVWFVGWVVTGPRALLGPTTVRSRREVSDSDRLVRSPTPPESTSGAPTRVMIAKTAHPRGGRGTKLPQLTTTTAPSTTSPEARQPPTSRRPRRRSARDGRPRRAATSKISELVAVIAGGGNAQLVIDMPGCYRCGRFAAFIRPPGRHQPCAPCGHAQSKSYQSKFQLAAAVPNQRSECFWSNPQQHLVADFGGPCLCEILPVCCLGQRH